VAALMAACGLGATRGFFKETDKWTEYNLGPFYVDTESDAAAARYDLTQLEQMRWVLGGLLEIKDLNTTWPIRVLITKSSAHSAHFALHDGCYLLAIAPDSPLPLGEVARLFLQANTPRIPNEVETGIAELFDTLKASGPHVSWGGRPAHPDLDFARMQLFATKFEYGASFHIFLTSLRNGSTLRAAERNAFDKDPDVLEKEAAARLAAGSWQAVSVSGRPLDPKTDFGDHSLDPAFARVYAAAALIPTNPADSEAILKQELNQGGPANALIFESLAEIASSRNQKPTQELDDAMHAGSKSAAVYFEAADGLAPDLALPLLRKAALLNPLWSEPVFAQAEATDDLPEREKLLKEAILMNPRSTDYLIALARTQMANGHALAAQSTWVRAEDSAPSDASRESVRQLHDSMESARLDEAAAERKREKDEATLADQRAQQAEADRIHAAEERANKASAAAAGSSDPNAGVVDWDTLVKTQKTSGHVVMVDCKDGYTRVAVRDLRGKTRQFLYREADQKIFSCDNKPETRQIVVTYRSHPDDSHGTDGDIVSVAWR
jgi:hypothetical protein